MVGSTTASDTFKRARRRDRSGETGNGWLEEEVGRESVEVPLRRSEGYPLHTTLGQHENRGREGMPAKGAVQGALLTVLRKLGLLGAGLVERADRARVASGVGRMPAAKRERCHRLRLKNQQAQRQHDLSKAP